MTHPRHQKNPTTAVNHLTKSPENTTTAITPKSPESHRIFTENDEIQLLKTLSQSPNNNNMPSLSTSRFTEAQIAKKVKRLKETYHKLARSKSRIKTPHDGEIYEIGRTIWGRNAAAKEKEKSGVEMHESVVLDVNLEEFPFLMNEMKGFFERNDEYCKQGLRKLGKKKLKKMNERWMELKLEESELMMNKAQLYHESLKFVVEGGSKSVSETTSLPHPPPTVD